MSTHSQLMHIDDYRVTHSQSTRVSAIITIAIGSLVSLPLVSLHLVYGSFYYYHADVHPFFFFIFFFIFLITKNNLLKTIN